MVEPKAGAEARYAKAQRDTHVQPKFGPAIHFLPELNMVLWGFPNDPKLKQLHRLLDHNALSELLREYWNSFHLPPGVTLASVATKPIKYAPHARCTLCHELRLEGAGNLMIYSKTFNRKTSGELIFKTMQTLWNAPVCQSGEIMIPEPLFFEPEMNSIFLRGIEGINADENPGELDLDRIATESGVALAGIHQCHIKDLPSRSDQQEAMSQVNEAEETLGDFDGAYSARVKAIAQAMWEKYPRLIPVTPTPIHGAFRLSQLLVVNGKLALVDFDDFSLGNPISDVASFVAHLLYLTLNDKLTPEQSRSAVRHFCRAYAERAPWGLPSDVLAWQTAAHLVGKQAKWCIKLAKKNYRNSVDQLLNMAVDILAGKLSLT